MQNKLKPCPFCGGKANIREFSCSHSGSGEFSAEYEAGCGTCKIYFRAKSIFTLRNGQPDFAQNGYDKVIEAWNRRKEDGD